MLITLFKETFYLEALLNHIKKRKADNPLLSKMSVRPPSYKRNKDRMEEAKVEEAIGTRVPEARV